MINKNIAVVVRGRWNKKGNIKVGRVWTWSTLAGDCVFMTDYGPVRGTCAGCCQHCGHPKQGKKRPPCYVFKSYRHKSVIKGHARNTLAMRENPRECFSELSAQIRRAKNKPVVCRFDQSGEIENSEQFDAMTICPNEHRTIDFYIYSKKYGIMTEAHNSGKVPENFTTLYSIWHDQGLAEYLAVAHLPNVKAFVYCDKNTDPVNGWGPEEYAARGLIITTWCKAYDEHGKLDHNITCEKCTKCFNRLASCKVIGTWDH